MGLVFDWVDLPLMSQDTIASNRHRYAVSRWSEGLFDIDQVGHLGVVLNGQQPPVALSRIVEQAVADGLRLPILMRFPQILQARAEQLHTAFSQAMTQLGYDQAYTPVYPIKVNQQVSVVQTLAAVEGMGLEVGSKPELIAALAVARPGTTLICNGYKDAAYIRLALAGQQLGLNVLIVIEKINEWPLIQKEAAAANITPKLGVRLRLSSLGSGNWQNTGGERAKFGLAANQLLDLVLALRSAGKLDWLQLLHFHMGSQISNLLDIQRGAREAGRYYTELVQQGVPIRWLDIGGGLGVDYEGGGTRSDCSMNYSLAQYAHTIVSGLLELCQDHDVPVPALLSESGRALTAHHAVLITDVTATEQQPTTAPPARPDQHSVIQHLHEVLAAVDEREPEESVLEAERLLSEGRNLFLYGQLGLSDRALIEPLYFTILHEAAQRLDPDHRRHRELRDRIRHLVSDKYFINLSIFQSLPDIWAIDQVFPIVPLSRLNEVPERRAVLEDLTCDSDGRIDHYVERGLLEPTLAVHTLAEGERYLLGIFLAGAYQETLGDIHNLFGDTDTVDIWLDDAGAFSLKRARQGDTADRLLGMVGHDHAELMAACQDKVRAAGLPAAQAAQLEQLLADGLSAYTYLDYSA